MAGPTNTIVLVVHAGAERLTDIERQADQQIYDNDNENYRPRICPICSSLYTMRSHTAIVTPSK